MQVSLRRNCTFIHVPENDVSLLEKEKEKEKKKNGE